MNFDRMRALLLEQAIRGELVPQLDSEGVVEQMRDAPEEIPFEIPEKWKWASLKVLVERTKQTIPEEEFTYIDVASIENFQVRATKKVKASEAPSRARKIAEAGMVLFATVRPYLKNICIVPNIEGSVIASTAFATMICTKHLDNKYLLYVLRSDFFTDLVKGKQRGISYPAISDKDFYSLSIPVPPIEEQKRIVAKLEKVFAEIDRAEKAYQELQTLSDALTKQILQKAIEGKLVSQLDSEGVVEQIGEVPEEVPFEIPESWKWVTLSKLVPNIVDCPHSTPKYSTEETDFRAIDTNCISSDGKIKSWRFVNEEIYKKRVKRLKPEKDDIIYTREGSIGRAARLPANLSVCMGQRVMLIRPGEYVESKYLQWFLMSPYALMYLTQQQRGIGVKHINVSDVKKLPIAVPPLLEQRRIVEKLEELLKQVEALKA